MMYDRDGHDWGWGTWLGMGLMMAVLAVLVVAAVVLVVCAATGPQKTTISLLPGTPLDTARDSAAQRVHDERSLAATSTKASTSPAGTCLADANDPHPGRRVEDYP